MSTADLMFMARALRHRNYRLFFSGQVVSLTGTWMTEVATSWLIYRLTGSALMLGAVTFAGQVPAFLLSPFTGVMVDRWDKRRLLMVTQSLSMVQSLALAGLTLSGRISVGWLIGLNAFEGLVNAFDMPCRHAFVPAMVEDKADLSNAIALNSSMFNAARIVGPSVGAVVIAVAGEGVCFLMDGVSFMAVLAGLAAMRLPPLPQAPPAVKGPLAEIREGWAYAYRSTPIRSIIMLMGVMSLFGASYGVMIPVFAREVFHGGPRVLGFLMTSAGCGALLGAVYLASRRTVRGLGRVIPLGGATFGFAVVAFAASRSLWVASPMLVLAGAGLIVMVASSNTIIQTIVDDDKRGRVMGLFLMSYLGAAPVGSLLAGWLADWIGAPWTLAAFGLVCVAGCAAFAAELPAIRAAIRPIYIRKGIVPQVAEGLNEAAELGAPPEER
jgi:MFS family permease